MFCLFVLLYNGEFTSPRRKRVDTQYGSSESNTVSPSLISASCQEKILQRTDLRNEFSEEMRGNVPFPCPFLILGHIVPHGAAQPLERSRLHHTHHFHSVSRDEQNTRLVVTSTCEASFASIFGAALLHLRNSRLCGCTELMSHEPLSRRIWGYILQPVSSDSMRGM